jgi:hypothetical protein
MNRARIIGWLAWFAVLSALWLVLRCFASSCAT